MHNVTISDNLCAETLTLQARKAKLRRALDVEDDCRIDDLEPHARAVFSTIDADGSGEIDERELEVRILIHFGLVKASSVDTSPNLFLAESLSSYSWCVRVVPCFGTARC